MAIFAVLAPSDSPVLATSIAQKFPGSVLKIGPGQWLIGGTGTAQQVCDYLQASDGSKGSVVVFAVSGYFGWAGNNIWEFIASKWMPR